MSHRQRIQRAGVVIEVKKTLSTVKGRESCWARMTGPGRYDKTSYGSAPRLIEGLAAQYLQSDQLYIHDSFF